MLYAAVLLDSKGSARPSLLAWIGLFQTSKKNPGGEIRESSSRSHEFAMQKYKSGSYE
jgi:hypothetical protein